tara:strand:- start:1160 stop:1369 length:210 start_codon:yes stop_codon:yes gene_type:complete
MCINAFMQPATVRQEMKPLNQQWLEAKQAYDKTALRHGPRSKRAETARAAMVGLLVRILRRDNRKGIAA